MDIRAAEISRVIRDQIANFDAEAEVSEVGTVLSVGDGIARIYGLDNVQAGEMVEFPGGIRGMPNHAPFLTTLRPGVVRVTGGGETVEYVVTGGFAEISPTAASILAEHDRKPAYADFLLFLSSSTSVNSASTTSSFGAPPVEAPPSAPGAPGPPGPA